MSAPHGTAFPALPAFERSLEYARHCDALDPLAPLRERFALPHADDGEPLLYLCGHSLGLQPHAARTRVLEELDRWARLGARAHEQGKHPWIDYHEHLGQALAPLAGALPTEIVVMNSLTINLHLMLASFYRPAGKRTRILIEAGAFPSDRHAVASQIAWHGLDARRELIELAPPEHSALIAPQSVIEYLQRHGERIALVLWPGVQYLTGQAFALEPLVQAAHAVGAHIGFDLAHSIGNLPLGLHASGADFAVWCSYKYLNAGPGAIGGCFVHERHALEPRVPRLSGWWGHERATRFEMGPQFRAAAGADGWQVSNPPILSSAPLAAALECFQAAGFERLRAKSQALTAYLEFLLAAQEVTVLTPRERDLRGCQLSLRLRRAPERARRIVRALDAAGVVCDYREPDVVRVAPVPLYNRFVEVLRFCELLAQACARSP
ncbi:MAG TPA: kynureninase [Steroidobacteraceae bacterium]|nr:kynureninase [Steroidobacteraceae bacterium]